MILNRFLPAVLLVVVTPVFALAQNINITNVTPAPNVANVALDANITVTFDQSIINATVQPGNIVVRGSHTGVIPGVLTGGGTNTITFNPANNFKPGEVISITITKLILGQSTSQGLVRGHTYSFTALVGAPESTPIQFGQRFITYSDALSQMDVKALDFENDGDIDLVFADAKVFGDVASLGINDGTGKFCITAVGETRIAEMNDLDGDGDKDLVSSLSGSGAGWTRNDGGGVFTEVILPGGISSVVESFRSGDIDSDGDIDFVLQSTLTGPGFAWFENNGAATFTAHGFATGNGGSYSYTQIADVNGDGAMDIIGYRKNLTTLAWYENNGSQVFTERIINAAMSDYLELTTADLDDDGDLDILSSNENNGTRIRWFANDGNENFTITELTTIPSSSADDGKLRVVDIDGDLDRDVIGGAQWLENNGSEVFTPHKLGSPLQQSQGIDYADIDGDGDLDLVGNGNSIWNQMVWFENTNVMNITAVSPSNGSHNGVANADITITFDQPIDAASVTNSSVIVKNKYRGVVQGALSVSGNTITFNPTNDFHPGEDISVALNNLVRSTSRHSLEKNYGFDFITKVSAAVTNPTFQTTLPALITYPADPVGLEVADLDNDGDLDIVTASAAELHWHRNDGTGTFTQILIPTTGTLSFPRLTDYNRDGRMDISVYTAPINRQIVYLNDASQSFASTVDLVQVSIAFSGFNDIDRDGYDDVLSARLYHYNCNRYTEVARVGSATTSQNWAYGDFDGDGDIDLMRALGTGEFHRNDGTNAFSSTTVGGGLTVARADLDGDGDLDVIYPDASTATRWYPNDLSTPSANFGAFKSIPSLGESRMLVTADFDGDGDIDLAGAGSRFGLTIGRNRVNEATANFTLNQTLIAPASVPFMVKGGDFNGDGKIDLVAASNLDNTIRWFPNGGIVAPPPTITSFSQDSGPEGAYIYINGTNFSLTPASNTVRFNGTLAVVSASTATRITAIVPVGATKGFVTVTIGGNTATSPIEFSLLPDIDDLDPWMGPVGTEVTITGSRFGPESKVYFDGTEAVIASRTSTTIVTHVPPGATTGYVEVHTSEGIATTSDADFTVTVGSGDDIVFDIHPVDQNVCPGNTAAFVVTAYSDDDLEYQWMYSATAGGPFSPVTGSGYSGATNNELSVNTTGSFGKGFYQCEVSNSTNVSVSDVAELDFVSCDPPVITPQPLLTQIGGTVSIYLIPLIAAANLDISSLEVVTPPASGAVATIDVEGYLTIDYAGRSFSGSETVEVVACDFNGQCSTETFPINVVGDVLVYNAVSPGGKNPILLFQFIEVLPDTRDNNVVIYNRWGDVVFEVSNYNNTTNVFAGISSGGVKLPSGTYYYKVTFNGGRKNMTGFLELRY